MLPSKSPHVILKCCHLRHSTRLARGSCSLRPTSRSSRGFFSTLRGTAVLSAQLLGSQRCNSFSSSSSSSSPFDKMNPRHHSRRKKHHEFIPRKAAVKLTETSRTFFKSLLENPPRSDIIGIMLNYRQSSSGDLRMVFSFDFCRADEIGPDDEGVSLELLEDGKTPKPPSESMTDGLPKLYVHHNAFLKVLGATVDVDLERIAPILYDREGNIMDPNA